MEFRKTEQDTFMIHWQILIDLAGSVDQKTYHISILSPNESTKIFNKMTWPYI